MEDYNSQYTGIQTHPTSIFLSRRWLQMGMYFRWIGPLILLVLFFGLWIYNSFFSGVAHANHGMSLYAQGHYDKAISELNQAISIDPKDDRAFSNRGLVYYVKGEYNQALADCEQALKLNPSLAAAYDNRGLVHLKMGDENLALSDFSQAIQLQPDNATALFNRATVYVGEGDDNDARTDLQKVLQVSTDAKLQQKAREQLDKLGSE